MAIGRLRTEDDVLQFIVSRLPDLGPEVRQLQGMTRRGSGSPEGSVEAPPGVEYLDQDDGATDTLWVKKTGTGDTGWTAVA